MCSSYVTAHFPDNFQSKLHVNLNVQHCSVLQADHRAALVDAHAAHTDADLDLPQQLPVCLAPKLHAAVPTSGGDGVSSLQLQNCRACHDVFVRLAAEDAFGYAGAERLKALKAAVRMSDEESAADIDDTAYATAPGKGNLQVEVLVCCCNFGIGGANIFKVLILGLLQLRRQLCEERLNVEHAHRVFLCVGYDNEATGSVMTC